MTRINCVPVQTLPDKFLLAEHNEITRVARLARLLKPGEAPLHYTMGEGHVKFFYDKGRYLARRYQDLKREMRARGFKTHTKKYPEMPLGCNEDWSPRYVDLVTNQARLDSNRDSIESKRGIPMKKTPYRSEFNSTEIAVIRSVCKNSLAEEGHVAEEKINHLLNEWGLTHLTDKAMELKRSYRAEK